MKRLLRICKNVHIAIRAMLNKHFKLCLRVAIAIILSATYENIQNVLVTCFELLIFQEGSK